MIVAVLQATGQVEESIGQKILRKVGEAISSYLSQNLIKYKKFHCWSISISDLINIALSYSEWIKERGDERYWFPDFLIKDTFAAILISWNLNILISWNPNILISWYPDILKILVSWYPDILILISSFNDILISWNFYILILRYSDIKIFGYPDEMYLCSQRL